MTYNEQDIIRLIDQTFRRYAADETFQRRLPLADIYDIGQLQSLLKQPDTLSALLILLNGVFLCSKDTGTDQTSLLWTADQYPLSYLGLSGRTLKALSHHQGLITVGDLLRMPDSEIAQIRGIGFRTRSMEEIQAGRMKFIREFQEGLIR